MNKLIDYIKRQLINNERVVEIYEQSNIISNSPESLQEYIIAREIVEVLEHTLTYYEYCVEEEAKWKSQKSKWN